MKFLKRDKNGDGTGPAGNAGGSAAEAGPDATARGAKSRFAMPFSSKAAPPPRQADAASGVAPATPVRGGTKRAGLSIAGLTGGVRNLQSKFGRRGSATAAGERKPGEKQIAAAKKAIQTPADISRPEVGVLAFGKKKTAVALQWIPPEEDVSVKERLAELTEHSHSDPTQLSATFRFYTDTRNTGFMGIGSQELGHSVGMRALVTMLSPQITGDRWVGAFQISPNGEQWWIGSIRDGKVFDDQVVNSRHQAEEVLLNDLQAPDWTAIFAPSEWGISGSRSEQLHEVVDLRLGEKLRSSTPVKDNLPRALLGTMVVAVALGGFTYVQSKKAEQARQLEELRLRAAASVTYEAPDLPWFMASDIRTFISDCGARIEDALLMVPGWENQPLSCSITRGEGSVATGWARNGGKTTWLRSLMPPQRPVPIFSEDFTTASWSEEFSSEVATGDEMSVTPWDPQVMESRIRERFLHYDLPINIRPAAGNQSAATNQVVFNAHEVQLSSELGFANFGDMLKDIPALVPDALVYSPATGIWDLTFRVNHPPIFPPEMR
ncbi:hypothetical protein [Paracoccus sp. ME4]|uniref:hypothetical protein n=1 Tax=Paracoccus sp. ME4 TaxID=3138066 RepID=UPI00398ACB18